ncbi:hypothetical protein MX659_00470 [Coriobacteriia bacterium Es71-Z0120]|uniref:hypothetical protein n=1 Tax=Parvivirga hydrogeniphila TaxID=2939460 RepID=UPI002260B9D4|nr:hypothetical protein [Parvivirga hydrogeniphila]MCL4078090.1 hypothetical protein [Parvivirga hydrogeniphila]
MEAGAGRSCRKASTRRRSAVGIAAAVALAVLVGAAGCAKGTAASSPPTKPNASATQAAAEAERPIETSEVAPPPMSVKDWPMPGRWNLCGLSDRFAAFTGTETTLFGDAPILLLDLQTGRRAVVRAHAVNREKLYGVVGLRCSDRWIVWEELRGNEQKEPYDCQWKLYAAKIQDGGAAVSEPVLLDESITSIQNRPLFAVIGDEVFWMTNSAPSGHQDGTLWGSRIKARRLPDGEVRTVFESDTNIATMSESEGRLVISQHVDNKGEAVVVKVIDPANGAVLREYDPRNGSSRIAHFPKVHGSALTWAVLDEPDSDQTTLLYADETTRGVLEGDGIDPVMVGPYVFYETLRVERTAGGEPREIQRIRGFDPAHKTCFTLYESRPATDGTWQIWLAQGYDAKRFVMVNDTSGAEAGAGDKTIVRVCEVEQ